MTYITLFLRDTTEVQKALVQFQRNPDWRQIAAFFLGLVFLSSLRHVWYADFLRRLLASASARIHGNTQGQDPEKSQQLLVMTVDFATRRHRVFDSYLSLLVFIALGTSSLSQFLSLLFFGSRSQSLCAITLGLGLGGSVAARVIGLFSLSLDLKHRFGARYYELFAYWFLLAAALGVTGGTIFFTLGQLAAIPSFGGSSICVKRHFLPTSLATSLTLILLQAYTITRILFGVVLPRGLWDISVRRAFALLVLDLAVLVPDALPTNVLGDFLPFSVAALIVLSAFASHASSPQPEMSKAIFHRSSQSSIVTSPLPEPSAPMAQMDRGSPTPSQRAFHNSLMGIPALRASVLRRMQSISDRSPLASRSGMPLASGSAVPPAAAAMSPRTGSAMPHLQMPLPALATPKELPSIPAESMEPLLEPRSGAMMSSSTSWRSSASVEDAVLQAAVRRPLPAGPGLPPIAVAEDMPRSGKIMASQVEFADQWEREHPEGLAPAPRPPRAPRPQLFVDTRRPEEQVSSARMTLSSNKPASTRIDHASAAQVEEGSARAHSKVSPLVMTPPSRRRRSRALLSRTSALLSRSPASPLTVESAPARQPSFVTLSAFPSGGGGVEAAAAMARERRRTTARTSNAPTFGRRSTRASRRPSTHASPEATSSSDLSVGQLTALFPPAPWMARPARPQRFARGPRAPPTVPMV